MHPGSAAGPGILGREERVVWYDLDPPLWHPNAYIEDPPERLLSTMEVYELEFAHRLSVIDAVTHSLDGSDVTPPGRTHRRARVRRMWVAGLVPRTDGGVG